MDFEIRFQDFYESQFGQAETPETKALKAVMRELFAKWEVFNTAVPTKSSSYKIIRHCTGFSWGGYLEYDEANKRFRTMNADGTFYGGTERWDKFDSVNQQWVNEGYWIISDK